MAMTTDTKYVVISVGAHAFLLFIFLLNLKFSTPLPVFENTNQHDVISAVVLGDVEKSKIVPQKIQPTPPPPPPVQKPVKVAEAPKPEPVMKKEVIALKKADKKKPKVQDTIANDLLNDIKKQSERHKKESALLADIKKQKQTSEKKLSTQFEKLLQAQAEKTLRQQFLNEDFKIKGERERRAQGEVDKYKALIIQSISEHWIIPTQANKKLSSELMIRLSSAGTVLDVQVTKSSGDPALDSSARAAVIKASPLPVPKDPEAFKAFKQFVLKVKPENVLNGV